MLEYSSMKQPIYSPHKISRIQIAAIRCHESGRLFSAYILDAHAKRHEALAILQQPSYTKSQDDHYFAIGLRLLEESNTAFKNAADNASHWNDAQKFDKLRGFLVQNQNLKSFAI